MADSHAGEISNRPATDEQYVPAGRWRTLSADSKHVAGNTFRFVPLVTRQMWREPHTN
jgi:hypothetical protein